VTVCYFPHSGYVRAVAKRRPTDAQRNAAPASGLRAPDLAHPGHMKKYALLLLLAFGLSLSACGPLTPSRSVSGSLAQELKSKSVASVEMSKLTDFEWDTMFIFGPYSFPAQICAELAFDKPECEAAQFTDVGEGEYLLIFVRTSAVARRETLSRLTADFEPGSLAKPIPRDKATFSVDRRTGRVVLACARC
jgi:hypothetical protein